MSDRPTPSLDERAYAALEARDYDTGMRLAREAVAAEPSSAAAREVLAAALLAHDRFTEALTETELALVRAPESARAHRIRAALFRTLGRLVEAEIAAREAVRCDEQSANAHFMLGAVLEDRGRLAEARASHARAAAIEPTSVLYRLSLARVLVDAEPRAAEALYREVLADHPRTATALNELGLLAERAGRRGEARALFAQAHRVDPSLAAARANRARMRGWAATVIGTSIVVAVCGALPAWAASEAYARGVVWLALAIIVVAGTLDVFVLTAWIRVVSEQARAERAGPRRSGR